jgi:hypothetical protein
MSGFGENETTRQLFGSAPSSPLMRAREALTDHLFRAGIMFEGGSVLPLPRPSVLIAVPYRPSADWYGKAQRALREVLDQHPGAEGVTQLFGEPRKTPGSEIFEPGDAFGRFMMIVLSSR